MEGKSSHLLPGLFADLVRCETRLYNALGERLRARHGLVTSQYEALRHLRLRPGARVGDLAAAFAIGVGASSKVVDRLEARGWVERRPNPDDRRSSLLYLTEEGTRLVDEAEATFTASLVELVGGALDPGEVGAVARALASLRAALEEERTGTPTG